MKIHEFIKTIKSQTAIFTTRNELDGAEFRFEAATTKIKIFRGIPFKWGEAESLEIWREFGARERLRNSTPDRPS